MTEPTTPDVLLPCPFCKAAVVELPQNSSRPTGTGWYQFIWCTNCGAQGGERKTEAEAIAAWNTRALSRPSPEPTLGSQSDAESDDPLVAQLLIDADEMEACGAGNEAKNMRKLVARLKDYRRAAITAIQEGTDNGK